MATNEITQMNIAIKEELHTEARIFCLKRNLKLKDLVSMALIDYLNKANEPADTEEKTEDLID